MMTSTYKAWLVATVVAVAVLSSFPAHAQTTSTRQCYGVVVDSVPRSTAGPGNNKTFSATAVLDLRFYVLFPAAPPGADAPIDPSSHTVELRVTGPRGSLYQSMTVPFTNDPAAAGQLVQVPTYPRPMAAQAPTSLTVQKVPYQAVIVSLPLGGTAIVDNSLYGKWTATAYLDGGQAACGTAAAFTITQ
jgi:hypothetical protein